MSARGARPSLFNVFSGIFSESNLNLIFPFEEDYRILSLAIVCTDRGMVSQFERFHQRGDISSFYRYMVPSGNSIPDLTSIGVSEQFVHEERNGVIVEAHFPNIIKSKLLIDKLEQCNIPFNAKIEKFGLSFPNPTDPSDVITIRTERPSLDLD